MNDATTLEVLSHERGSQVACTLRTGRARQVEPHELHRRRVAKARHARAMEKRDVASLAFSNLCHSTRRSIFTPRRHLVPRKPTARGKGTTAIEVAVIPNAPHEEHSRVKGRHTEHGSTETHQRPQKSQTQNPRMTPPRHDRPSSRLQTPIRTCITSKTNIHSARSTGTPRHDGAVFLHCRAMRTSWTATSKIGQERQHQTGETAVARESTRMEHRAHRAHTYAK